LFAAYDSEKRSKKTRPTLIGVEPEGTKLVAMHRQLHTIQKSVTNKSDIQKDLPGVPAA